MIKLPLFERVKYLLDYDPETGVLTRKISRGCTKAGDTISSIVADGYIGLQIDGHAYLAHRIIYLWMTGEEPPEQVDHRNLIRTDNRWENLRAASQSQNRANTRTLSNNTSGYKGVDWYPKYQKWRARIAHQGQSILVGYFQDPAIAYDAYCKAAYGLKGDFARVA